MPSIGDMPYQQLIRQLQDMSNQLASYQLDPKVAANIDDFWYWQKITELKTLNEQFDEAMQRVHEIRKLMDENYFATRKRYKRELRWLKKHYLMPV